MEKRVSITEEGYWKRRRESKDGKEKRMMGFRSAKEVRRAKVYSEFMIRWSTLKEGLCELRPENSYTLLLSRNLSLLGSHMKVFLKSRPKIN